MEGDYQWITASDIEEFYINKSEQFISKDSVFQCNYKLFPKKSILLVCIASIGKIGMINKKSYSNQQITAIFNSVCNPNFLMYSIIQQIEKIKLDASSNVVPIINTGYLKNMLIGLPLNELEQQQIADFLDQKSSEIDLILSKKANQLDIIKEHKKSLIYEYVTGKKRVGGVENGD